VDVDAIEVSLSACNFLSGLGIINGKDEDDVAFGDAGCCCCEDDEEIDVD